MKDILGTATIIASIAIAVALMLMAPKGIEASSAPVVSSDAGDVQ
jgi:hypothetical protein